MKLPTMSAFKAEAKQLKVKDNLKYMVAMDIVAKKYGFKNWNIAKTKLSAEEERLNKESSLGKKIICKIEALLREIQDEQTQIGNYMQEYSLKAVTASNSCLLMIEEKETSIEFLNSLLHTPIDVSLTAKYGLSFFTYEEDAQLIWAKLRPQKSEGNTDGHMYSIVEVGKGTLGTAFFESFAYEDDAIKRISFINNLKTCNISSIGSQKDKESSRYRTLPPKVTFYWEYTITMKDGEHFYSLDKEEADKEFRSISNFGEWEQYYKKEFVSTNGQDHTEGKVVVFDHNTKSDAEYWVWGCIGDKDTETFGLSFEKASWANDFRDHLNESPDDLIEYTERDPLEFTSIETRYQKK